MYVLVLLVVLSTGQPVFPSPIPKFDTEEACKAWGSDIISKLSQSATESGIQVLGKCVKVRDEFQGPKA